VGSRAGYGPAGIPSLFSVSIADVGTGPVMKNAAACAGALAVQRRLHDDGLLARVAPLGLLLEKKLRAAFGEHPQVGDIRGRGMFWAVELVADRATREPFDPKLRIHARIKKDALKAGLLCYPMGGTLDGLRGDHVLLAPPFIVGEEQFDELVGKLGGALEAVLKTAVAA